jgi:NmrA-like family
MAIQPLLGALPRRENGAVVFAVPTGDGHIPAICLEDIGWWVRYTFDHRAETSGQELKIATEMMTGDQLVETFTRVTGIPAIRRKMSVEEYVSIYQPRLSRSIVKGQSGPSVAETYSSMWRMYTDDLLKRDMEWIRRTHPTGYTLESWIREKGYDGTFGPDSRFWESKTETPKASL